MQKNGQARPMPAAPSTQAALAAPVQPPLWVATIAVYPDGRVDAQVPVVNRPGIGTWDVAKTLSMVAGAYFGKDNARLSTKAEQEAHARKLSAIRDYPATVLYPELGLYLCAACADAYEHCLEGEPVKLPAVEVPIPCTYHAHPEKAPKALADAITDANQKDEEDGKVVTVDGSKPLDAGGLQAPASLAAVPDPEES